MIKSQKSLILANFIRQQLKEIAIRRETVYYSHFMNLLNVSRFDLADLLGIVVELDKAEKSPLLSSLVVTKDTMMPSFGFYKKAKQEGLTNEMPEMNFVETCQRQAWERYAK